MKEWSDEDLTKHCKDLHIKLTDQKNSDNRDIDVVSLIDELKNLQCFVKNNMSSHDVLNYIYRNNLTNTFPNITIVLRIYFTLPVSVASGERSFSKSKLIKNYLRSTMSGERLTDLALISIENDIMDTLDFKNLIKNFVATKARRVNI